MKYSILGLLHNLKDYEHYEGEPYKLVEDEKNVLVSFLEQEDVQRCIPKVPRFGTCPNCGTNVTNIVDNCEICGQRLKWVENNEKTNNKGSSIFSNFGIDTNTYL